MMPSPSSSRDPFKSRAGLSLTGLDSRSPCLSHGANEEVAQGEVSVHLDCRAVLHLPLVHRSTNLMRDSARGHPNPLQAVHGSPDLAEDSKPRAPSWGTQSPRLHRRTEPVLGREALLHHRLRFGSKRSQGRPSAVTSRL